MSSTIRNVKTVSCAECRRLKVICANDSAIRAGKVLILMFHPWRWTRVPQSSLVRLESEDVMLYVRTDLYRHGLGIMFAVFHETERLKNRIYVLTDRVHDLETALERLQSRLSPSDRHPLLSDELRAIGRESDGPAGPDSMTKDKTNSGYDRSSQEKDGGLEKPKENEEDVSELKEGLGTLTLHPDGRSRFYGPTAAVESLFQSEFHDNETAQNLEVHPKSPASGIWPQESNINAVGGGSHFVVESKYQPHWFAAPLLPDETAKAVRRLEGHLPEHAKAWSLCETYFEHATWLYSCIQRKDFLSDIFSRVYNPASPNGSLTIIFNRNKNSSETSTDESISMDKAGIMFMAFAIGTLLDLTAPEHHLPMLEQAELYHELACTALGIAGASERGSLNCVQCLMLMSYYHLLVDKPGSGQRAWALVGLNVNIAQCIGLHRDSAWWNKNPEDVQRRRDVFWELFTFERMQSLTLGLPPSLSLDQIDCEFPEDTEKTTTPTGEVEHSFVWRKKQWAKSLGSEVIDVLMRVSKKPMSYPAMLKLDKKVRDDLFLKSKYIFGSSFSMTTLPTERTCSSMQSIVNVLIQETVLLLIHRLYLARALHGPPTNIFGSKYGPSVLASFRSASHIVTLHQNLAALDSALTFRFWFIWNNLLGASIVLAALATKNPWCTIAPDALRQLDLSYGLFQRAASHGAIRPAKALSIVARLRENAHKVYEIAQKRPSSAPDHPHPNSGYKVGTAPEMENQGSEELNILFGGHRVREIPKRQPSLSMATTIGSSQNSSGFNNGNYSLSEQQGSASGSASSGSSPGGIFDSLHPDLMEDLQSTNKLNEARYPWFDWTFEGLASWNNVQNDAPVPDIVYAPPEGIQTILQSNASSVLDGTDMMRDGLGIVAGGITWDPSWQSLMDQLGVSASHSTSV
ncbi:hypothetical protein K439DRAFT_1665095 [Ramaria rubella]|nr:hypothetical protein K439DRAFT_1665095 [Ramaria rubella]